MSMYNKQDFMMIMLQIISVFFIINISVGLANDDCKNSTLFHSVFHAKLMENSTLHDPIFIYDNALSGALSFVTCNDRFYFNGSTVYQQKDLTKDCSVISFSCRVNCNGGGTQDLRISKRFVPHGEMHFNESQYSVTVKEGSLPGFITSLNGQIVQTDCYGIGSGTGSSLQIETNYSTHFSNNGFDIRTTRILDYEEKTEYTIQLIYQQYDADAMFHRQSRSTLIVRVEDIDDLDPVFNHTLFIYNITENTVQEEWNETTPKMSAYDGDFGEARQKLNFSFENDRTTNGEFVLNPSDGSLKVTTALDREKKDLHLLIIEVKQLNNFQRSATASLQINVLDENDNVPKFDTNVPVLEAWIDEHSSSDTIITRVMATDKDTYPNNKVTYMLSGYTDQFLVENNNAESGTIKVNTSDLLDRETLGDVLTLHVIAFDELSGKMGGNVTLRITLKDINDNTPTFNKSMYDFNGDSVGPVGQVNATDEDDPQIGNGKVLYALLREISEVSIDNKTGQINLTMPIEDEIEFFVEACDCPNQISSKRCSQVRVVIRANASAQRDEFVHASVYENSPFETVVIVIKIKGTNYESVGENGPFKLDKQRGAVKVNEQIDRENSSESYTMNIHVKSTSDRLIANITLTIEILDANDNTPTFEKHEYFFELPDQLSTGTVIGTVNAFDLDTGNNSLLHYYIPDSLISPNFDINRTSGEIRVSDHDFPDGKEFFQFPVSVKDHGIPPLKSGCYVYISRTIVRGRTVQIGTPYSFDEMQTKKGVIERSYMHIEATNGTVTAISAVVLQRKVLQHMGSIQALFRQQTITTTHKPNDFGGSQIALIVLAVVILIGGIVLIYMIYKSRSLKAKDDNSIVTVTDEGKQTEEPTKLSETDNVSMQSIEITVDIGNERTNQSDQTSDYDGSQNAISESNAVGCINPAYQADTQEMVLSNDTMQGQTTSKEVEHELNQLTDMLDEEEKRDGCSMEDQEESSLDVPKLYPSLPINETAAGAHHQYENTNVFPIQDNENNQLPILCGEQEMHDDRDQDRKSSEFIMSSNNLNSNQGEMSERNNEKPGRSYENIVDVLDDEPDIDYNDKQVRFAAVVLDSEENKFEPIKDKEEEQTTEPDEDIDDIGDETVQNDNEDEHEEHGQLEYRPNDETTLQDVIETRSEESALEEEVTAF